MSEPDEHPDDETAAGPAQAEAEGLLDELLADRPTPSRELAPLSTRVGRIVEWTLGQAPRVEFEGNERGPLIARSVIPLDPTTLAEAITTARGVVLTFEDGRPDAPIITGLLQDFTDLGGPPQIWEQEEPEQPEPASNLAEVDAKVDGKRVVLEAADEIVLACGQASIVLRRNGRVVIRGTYVESRSRGVNRIKGGSVEIN